MSTKTSKDYVIKHMPQTALYKITLQGGGEVADALKGLYTSPTRAQEAIMVYNETKSVDRKVSH